MSVELRFSSFAAIHGARPCDECGGPTTYWHAATGRHLCPWCADEADTPGIKPPCGQCGAEAGELCRRPIGYPCLRGE